MRNLFDRLYKNSTFALTGILFAAAALAMPRPVSAQGPPAVLWQVSGVYLMDHNLVNRVVRGPFDFPSAVAGSTGRLEWHNEGNSADYSFIEFANVGSEWSYGKIEIIGEGYGWHQVRRRFNYWAGGGAFASPRVYIRALPNGQRPNYRVEVGYDVDLWAEATRGAQAVGPHPLSPRVASQPGGIPRIVGVYNFVLNDRNALRGPVSIPEYPSEKYFYLDLWQFVTDTEVGLGYPFEAVTDQASARLTYRAHAWINEGVPPVAQLEEPNGSPVKIMPAQIGPPLRFVSSSYDPDNPGQEPLKGIVRHEWSFEREDGSIGQATGSQVSLGWNKEGTYRVRLTVIDDEFMRASAEVVVVVEGPTLSIALIERAKQEEPSEQDALCFYYYLDVSTGNYDHIKHFRVFEEYTVNGCEQPGLPWSVIPSDWLCGLGDAALFITDRGVWFFRDCHKQYPYDPALLGRMNGFVTEQRYLYTAPWLREEDPFRTVRGGERFFIERRIVPRGDQPQPNEPLAKAPWHLTTEKSPRHPDNFKRVATPLR